MAQTHDRPSGFHAASSSPAPAIKDALSDVLRTVKLAGALFFAVDASTPWGIEVPEARLFAPIILPKARHIVSYHIVLEGHGWACLAGLEPCAFASGDVLVMPHADAYAMLSAPGQQPEFDHAATLAFFRSMAAGRLPFTVTEGGGGEERARFVCGFLGCDMRPYNPLLDSLPRLLHVRPPSDRPDDLLDRLVEFTLTEAQRREPGGQAIFLGLGELMFVEVLRRHLSTLPDGTLGWLAGLRDPTVGRALAELHDRPAHPWTLAALASNAGVSRSVLAERFTQLVGQPPMHYLTRWRMQMAARLLVDGTLMVKEVGPEVGYESEAAFSRAFKKIVGISPAAWRQSSVKGDVQ